MKVIEVEGLNYRYERDPTGRLALENVNFSVRSGELMAIVGPSGSGKSTLLSLIGCMLSPPRGSIRIEGVDLGSLSGDELAVLRSQKFGFVFQQFHLTPRMTILDNILLPVECAPVKVKKAELKERAKVLAKRLGLEQTLGKFPNQLSGGQQQRVAIARALLMKPGILIADEPTGNLDSQTGQEIMAVLEELHTEGTTVIVVTHDDEIARLCKRRLEIRDGRASEGLTPPPPRSALDEAECGDQPGVLNLASSAVQEKDSLGPKARMPKLRRPPLLSLSLLKNLRRNWLRSLLTMSGVAIGIAAVLSMVTLGRYTKASILETYEALGVNKLSFHAYPNWRLKATDTIKTNFYEFTETDLESVMQVFPELARLSPVVNLWGGKTLYGGREMTEVGLSGVNEHYIPITRRTLAGGMSLLAKHVELRSAVCVVGYEVAETLFRRAQPVGQTLFLGVGDAVYPCRVIGVLDRLALPNEGPQVNKQILIPFTFAKMIADNDWTRRTQTVLAQAHSGADLAQLSKGIEALFKSKYGNSVSFRVSQNDVVVSQMKRFLSIFSLLLGSIAAVALVIGGIGLANMMLVSVAERYREIGVRKAVGATDRFIMRLFLGEALALCLLAGIFGLVIGFAAYETLIWAAAEFSDRIEFAWIIDPSAVVISFVGIVAVGILSGVVPALKAKRREIALALRSE